MRPFAITVPITLSIVSLPLACTYDADRRVERVNIELAADLRTRGALERDAALQALERWRGEKHTQIDAAHIDALRALELVDKLTADSSRKAADRFTALHRELDRMAEAARDVTIQQHLWFDHAAAVVLRTVEYHQLKDRALLEGGQAALEAFANTYTARRKAPPGDQSTQAAGESQDLLDKLHSELSSFLSTQLGLVR